MSEIKVAIITISDTCHVDKTKDKSGPYLISAVGRTFANPVVEYKIVPDEVDAIEMELLRYSDIHPVDLIITTGGTGFTKRDVTPEATSRVIQRHAPGISAVMCLKSVQITEMAMLSRSVCGIRENTLIINMPGSLKAVRECYQFIENVLPHAINQIKGETCQVKATHQTIQSSNENLTNTVSHCCSHKSTKEGVAYRHRESPYPMVSVDDALNKIASIFKDGCSVIRDVPCVGSVCMEDVVAPEPYPRFRASIKDGYACVSGDGKGVRRVRDGVTAGEYNTVAVRPGECVRISTGAPLPPGADCVVQVEDTKLLKHSQDGKVEYEIEIMTAPHLGQDIRQIGSDVKNGEKILPKHTYIGPAEFGLLKSFGITSILCSGRIRIGVLSTGNEVKDTISELDLGHIRDSNRPMLISLLRRYTECVDLGIVNDEENNLYDTLHKAFVEKDCDLVVTSGGVSMGEKDLLKHVLTKQLNFEILFGRVNMKPGKPTTFATGNVNNKKRSIFALPGNPVSAYVTCNLFVVPAVKILSGRECYSWPRINVELSHDVHLDPRPEYARATFRFEEDKLLPVATVTGNQISSRITSLVGGQVLLELPNASVNGSRLSAGSHVSALLINNV